jgi:anti-anti-sigma factor
MLNKFEAFRIEHLGALCIVRALGDVDLANSNGLEKTLREASVVSAGPIIASFADCTFADCSCLNVLIRAFKTLGARLHIVAPPKSSLRRVLDLTSMSSVLQVHDEIGAALLVACPPRGESSAANPRCA